MSNLTIVKNVRLCSDDDDVKYWIEVNTYLQFIVIQFVGNGFMKQQPLFSASNGYKQKVQVEYTHVDSDYYVTYLIPLRRSDCQTNAHDRRSM